jgi:hypothetical protein
MPRVVPLIVAMLLLAACGGSGGGTSDATQIKQAWTAFFSAKTSVSERVATLQDGARFKATIANLATNPLASQLSAKVSSVMLEGADKAKVVYSIYFGNTAAFPNQIGYAYKQNGKWLVGFAGLCKLIAQQGTTPAACTS